MDWHDWNDKAFEEARERGCPVLLFLHASWCRWSRELEQQVFADPEVERLMQQNFVRVRVDKDRRPDIDARYSKGGWPTLAWLDDAGELIASDAYLDRDPLIERLQLVAGYWAENRESIRRRLAESAEQAERDAASQSSDVGITPADRREVLDWVSRTLLSSSDPRWGGWGKAHKFPHPEAIDFALIRWSQTGDEDMRKLVLRTLRNMQQGEIYDHVEGGFYRYATQPDWSAPHTEKVLDSNAGRLFAYLEAYQALGDEELRSAACGTLEWLCGTLLDPETGAFRGSQDADPAYARLSTLEARRRSPPPPCDPTLFANWNAMTVSALLQAARVLDDERWAERGLRTLEFLCDNLFDERLGVHHYWDGSYHLPGLLSDQAYVLRALLDACEHTGGAEWLERAQVLAGWTIETLRSPSGAFFDRRPDPSAAGGLRRRNLSILENAVMAESLLRLAQLTREENYAHVAEAALTEFLPEYKRYAHFVAGYARCVDLLEHPPVHVTIIGQVRDPRTRELRRAATSAYLASRIVQVLDPSTQATLIDRFGLPHEGARDPHAYVHRGRESYADTSDPRRLPALMARIEHPRD